MGVPLTFSFVHVLKELVEAELCAELVQEAKGLAAQADSLRKRDQSRDPRPDFRFISGCWNRYSFNARYAHWEEAAVRLPAAINTEAALRDRVEQLSEQEQQVYSQAGQIHDLNNGFSIF